MQYGNTPDKLIFENWDVGIFGNDVDDRGERSKSFIQENSAITEAVEYKTLDFTVVINGEENSIDDMDDYFSKFTPEQKFVIDCTTLGVVEMLIIIQSLYNNGIRKIDAIYIEPSNYKSTKGKIVHKRDFELSSEFDGYTGIPGHTLYMSAASNDKFIFFCGYESERIERAIEDLNINNKKCQLVFGVPAFHSGWEMNSFSNNIRVIERRNLGNSFYYCGASNPMAVCEKLGIIYGGLGEDEHLFIIPVGTKPMALGACIFKVSTGDKDRLAFLYDHPHRSKGRSSDVAKWNLYNITL